jgi:hypothetical protein
MATIKRAAKKAAKKAVPKVEAPKQIVLTEAQFDILEGVKDELNNLTYSLGYAFTNENNSIREVAFEIGTIKSKIDIQQEKLNDIVATIDPNPIEFDFSFDEDDEEDENSDDDN